LIGSTWPVDDVFCIVNRFMRRLFVIGLLSLSLMGNTQVRIIVQGGMNFSNIHFKYDEGKKGSYTAIPRFNGGLMFEIPLDNKWFLYTGPNYSGKGYVMRIKRPSYALDSVKVRLNYLELPLTIGYKFSNDKLTLNSGVYFAYGFNGVRTYNLNRPEPEKHLHLEGEAYRRLDIGYNLAVVYKPIQRVGIKLGYSKSMVNISRYTGGKEKNNVFGFSLFCYITKKKEAEE